MTARTPPTLVVAVLAALTVLAALGAVVVSSVTAVAPSRTTGRPPDADGYFLTRRPGAWDELPGDRACRARVHRSTWEPRPDNDVPNHRLPDRTAVRQALAVRPRARMGAYSPRWDRWLLPRVSGQYAGTTDEILQWAACKWGLSDNVLRAMAVRESGWLQHEVYPDGTCVVMSGCGDVFGRLTPAARVYCRRVSAFFAARGHGVGATVGSRVEHDCPRTFSIVGVMSWHDPAWGRLRGNQNGTFPFNVESTAYAVDYLGSFLRGCLEGWVRWLGSSGAYGPGDLDGCIGAWYAGAWHTRDADRYAALVAREVRAKRWLTATWRRYEPPCSPEHGCPQPAP